MTTNHTARQGIFNYLTGRAICPTPRSAEEAELLLDAFAAEERAVVLAEAAERQYEHLRRQGRGQDIVCEGCSECLPREYVELINVIEPTVAGAGTQAAAVSAVPSRADTLTAAADVVAAVRDRHYGPGEFKAEKIALNRAEEELRRLAAGEPQS